MSSPSAATSTSSPVCQVRKIIFQAFEEVKPNLIVAVPLIIEKIIKKSVLPKLETPTMKILLKVPIINDKIKATIREEMIKAFGGNFREIIVGGAAFNQEVEQFLKMIDFPYTVGYGMTECGPIIYYETGQDSSRVRAEKPRRVWTYGYCLPIRKISLAKSSAKGLT